MAPSLKVYLRMLREIALKHTGQRTGNICLAGMKSPLWPSQSFWERGLLDSFHISFVLMYKDFSVQVNLSLHTCWLFQGKRNARVAAQQPLWVQEDTGDQGPAAWPCSSQHTGISATPHPTGHQQNRTWLCLGAPSPRGAVSLTYLEFSSGAFCLSLPCLKPKQMSFNYF